jgi:hypothetical protein
VKAKTKRVYQDKLWHAARLYRNEAEKCYKARAYFSAMVARGCELEALLRIFDFVETRRARDRCHSFNALVNRAFAKHWFPHDGLKYWKRSERVPLKRCLHELREARNGVHANLFQKDLVSRRAAANVTFLVQSVGDLLQIKNGRQLMKHAYESGEISRAGYNAWKKKAGKIE